MSWFELFAKFNVKIFILNNLINEKILIGKVKQIILNCMEGQL
jgi:hypothetical protein